VCQASAKPRALAERAGPNGAEEPRFMMLEPIREYALERLATRSDAETIRQRHAHYFTTLAEAAAAEWNTPRIESAVARQRREYDNMRARFSGHRIPAMAHSGSGSPRRSGGSGGATTIPARGAPGWNSCWRWITSRRYNRHRRPTTRATGCGLACLRSARFWNRYAALRAEHGIAPHLG
jgi:hypothetical protein